MIDWLTYGHQRRRGRSALTWSQEIIQKVGTTSARAAQNRRIWDKIKEVYDREWGPSTQPIPGESVRCRR